MATPKVASSARLALTEWEEMEVFNIISSKAKGLSRVSIRIHWLGVAYDYLGGYRSQIRSVKSPSSP